jgi:hypothetical protein
MEGLSKRQQTMVREQLEKAAGHNLGNLNGGLATWFLGMDTQKMLDNHLMAISIINRVKGNIR